MGGAHGSDPVRIQDLRIVAGVLAVIVASIHVFHPELGVFRLVQYLRVGTLFDPRPPVFVLSGALIFVGIAAVYYGKYVKVVYALGIALMVTYIVGYAAWHTVLGHGAFWPYLHSHHHDTPFVESMVNHLTTDRIALISKLHEIGLLIVLLLLLKMDTE